ncbi:ATP-binding protein [Chryseobacterium kwangjuense]|uniref:ATP-binding protein n=1 Tax=Chryseobacterium kwangjuense TaxID=267125 RepID=A0ABW9JYQ1_9FLAO
MSTDYSKYSTADAAPIAVNMLESFRAVGYNMEAAVADILDNSISAGAKNIWIDFEWKGADSTFSLKDDGCGMVNDELINAMRPGSKNPNEERDINDLGRFGLGLKTASFSQCRKYSVISKKRSQKPVFWTWDLDYVYRHAKEWKLIASLPDGNWNEQIQNLYSGTIVIWQDMDHLLKGITADNQKAYNKFLQTMEYVKKHIATVFHRYIEDNKIKIFFKGREVEAWNPFLIKHTATQSFPEEPLQNGKIKVRGFVLPHKSKLTQEEFSNAEGAKGWNAQQGFYVYRNERMLVNGEWLGLFRKEEHFKLSRIMIDLPNSLDGQWQIDIKKSVARAPFELKDNLKAYASQIRARAVEVYRHRGKVIQRNSVTQHFQPVWIEKQKYGKRYYEINQEHPLIASMDLKAIKPLIRLLEETIPVPLIVINESENPDSFFRPFEKVAASSELKELLKTVYKSLLNTNAPEQAKSRLLLIEPFNEYPELIECL